MPHLTFAYLDTLIAPITLEDITTTIKNLANNKAPGPDEYTFYKLTWDYIPDAVLWVYKTMWKGVPYLPTGSRTYIKMMAKKGKYRILPGFYRHISFINVDAKILFKIVASCLADWLYTIIHPAQNGFVKGRSTTLNIYKITLALKVA